MVEVIRFQSIDLIPYTAGTQEVHKVISLIYLSFSLDMFVHDSISYCLWDSAKAIDILRFKYMTIIYILLLIILLIIINRCSRCFRCGSRQFQRISNLMKHLKFKDRIIHGLSAFLILGYVQCARCCFMLLATTQIYGKNESDYQLILYYGGGLELTNDTYFYRYAFPAFLLVAFVLILPPLLLLIYPAHNKTLLFLKISKNRCVKTIFQPLNNMKPIFDSFQGCFKDEFRFFSGIYFFYRFFIMLNVIVNYLHTSFLLLEIQLVGMLIFHAICQPYKKCLLNVIDSLLFGNLAFINAIILQLKPVSLYI